MARTRSRVPGALVAAARRLETWRRRRTKRVIPPEIWKRATELGRRFGVSATASALRLDYYGLKRRIDSVGKVSRSGPAFVQIGPSLSPVPSECLIEIEDARGTKLRVVLRGVLGSGA